MATENAEMRRQIQLRTRAALKLGGDECETQSRLSSTAALRVLHALASSPATAADAIALLHELQVHQVELELQYEELQNMNAELETSLRQETQLYDHAPVALFSMDASTALVGLNLAAARLLGEERHVVLGQALDRYLTADSRPVLNAALQQIRADLQGRACMLELVRNDAAPVAVQASLAANPAGAGFLLALGGIDSR